MTLIKALGTGLFRTLLVALLLTSLGTFALFTPAGNLIIIKLSNFYPDLDVQVQSLDGQLFKALNLKNVAISYQGKQLKAKSIQLRWQSDGIKAPFTLSEVSAQEGLIKLDENPAIAFTSLQADSIDWKEKLAIDYISINLPYGKIYGTIKAYLDIAWDLDIKTAEQYFPQIKGDFKTSGQALFDIYKTPGEYSRLNLNFESKSLTLNDNHFQDTALSVKGSFSDHKIQASTKFNDYRLTSKLIGTRYKNHYRLQSTVLSCNHSQWGAFPSSKVQVDVNWTKDKLHTQMSANMWGQNPLMAEIHLALNDDKAIAGKLEGNFKDIRWLSALSPDIQDLKGLLKLDIVLSGSLNNPKIQSNFTLSDASMQVPSLNTHATISQMNVNHENESISLNAHGSLGDGVFSLVGEKENAQADLNVHLKGDGLIVSNTSEYFLKVNPDLKLSINHNKSEVTGSIFVKEANIAPKNFTDTVSTSPDVVLVTDDRSAQSEPFYNHVESNVQIQLGESVKFKGFGINSYLAGNLQLTHQLGKIARAKGSILLVDGNYQAYGQTLDLNHGQIRFTGGPITEPELEARAQKTVRSTGKTSLEAHEQIVGIGIKGPLQNIKVQFFAEPFLPKSHILSYILTGKQPSEISQAQSQVLFQVATQLANFVGEDKTALLTDVTQNLPFDTIEFVDKFSANSNQSKKYEDSILKLGKQISNRLYLNYSIGLFNNTHNLGLKYLIGRNVTLEGKTGHDGFGADIVFSFERG